MKRLLATLMLLIAISGTADAIDTGPAFDDPVLQARYEAIIEEVRCLKCQNQSIKDSNAFLAADLRREIRRMLEEGYTDTEIYDFLVERYGEFALYRPRQTYLWVMPVVLLLAGGLFLFMVLRRRMALPIDRDADEEANA